jgi:hypothetical protein
LAGAAAQARSGHARLRRLGAQLYRSSAVAVAGLALPQAAQASAWIASEERQSSVTAAFGETAAGLRAELETYSETPLFRGWSGEVLTRTAYDIDQGAGQTEVDGALKRQILNGKRTVAAVQLGVTWREDVAGFCSGFGGEARFLVGRSFGGSARGAFTNVEIARRSGPCPSTRSDLTLGWRTHPDWLFMGQYFGHADRHGRADKAQISVVRRLSSAVNVQIGLRQRVRQGGGREQAIVVGLWTAR